MRRARLLDYGGGSGLLCRLLRDIGVDAWTCDPYGTGEYARLFSVDAGAVAPGSFEVVTAFEVFEHLPGPRDDLAKLFQLFPEILVASTEPYRTDYDESWWYLVPGTGQHVFFYSQSALQKVADMFGYSLRSIGGWHIFSRRPITPITCRALGWVLSCQLLEWWRAIMETIPNQDHINRDFQRSLERQR
jgi:Methyltransferase domain